MMAERDLSRDRFRHWQPWILIEVCAVAVVAVVAGIIWNRVVPLPGYTVGSDFRARMAESGLKHIAATDVYFSLIAAVGGLILGVVAWVLFRRLGWPVTLIAAGGAALAGVIARLLGEFIGPRNFEARMAVATGGDTVTVNFEGHTWAPLAVWVGMAVIPVLIGSLGRGPQWISHVPQDTQPQNSPADEVG